MTFIAEGGGRTVTNSTVYDKRKVYEITTSVVLDVYEPHPGGEMNRTGETSSKTIIYHVIATSDELARALFAQKWGSKFSRHTLIDIRALFCIDGEISYGHN